MSKNHGHVRRTNGNLQTPHATYTPANQYYGLQTKPETYSPPVQNERVNQMDEKETKERPTDSVRESHKRDATRLPS